MKKASTVFCVECGDFEEYTENSSRESVTVRGITFDYVEKTACCARCGQRVYVPEINDENVEAQENAYRKAAGLISISEIRELLEKYDTGAAPLALQKLLYFSQAFYEAIFGTVLFSDKCQAWTYGPVYPEIYSLYKPYNSAPIEKPLNINRTGYLTADEVNLLDSIVDTFGSYSGMVLSRITHSERPWLEARGNLHPEDKSTTVIDPETIRAYFREVVRTYGIEKTCDISKYCDAMCRQIKNNKYAKIHSSPRS